MGIGRICFVSIILTILIAVPVFSEEFNLTFMDASTKQRLSDIFLTISYDNKEISEFVGLAPLLIDLQRGAEITIAGENISTLGKDYYRKTIVGEDIIYLFQTGTIRGIVKDKLDNIVSYADLKFECSNNIGCVFPSKTDKFGSFNVDFAPVGKCKISAYYNNAIGFNEVQIEPGKIVDIEIKLDRSILSADAGYDWVKILLFTVLILILAVFVVVLIRRYKSKKAGLSKEVYRKQIKKEKLKKRAVEEVRKEKIEGVAGKRAEDIMKTLNENEKNVVNFLIENKNKAAQSSIRHALGIPRTTLSRIVESLERKNIIKVERLGKAVKIELTDWFLGKE